MPIPSVPIGAEVPLLGYGDVEQTFVQVVRMGIVGRPEAVGVIVGTRLSADETPGRRVLIRRVGGVGPRFGVDLARMDIQVWHDSDTQAHDLAALVRALCHQARGVDTVRGVRDNAGPIPSYDPDSKKPRYILTIDATLKGVQL